MQQNYSCHHRVKGCRICDPQAKLRAEAQAAQYAQLQRKAAIAQAIWAIARRRHETKTERPQEKKFWDLMKSPEKKQRCYDICAEEGLLEVYAEEIAEELAPKRRVISEEQIKLQQAKQAEELKRRAAVEAGEAAVAAAISKRKDALSSFGTTFMGSALPQGHPVVGPARPGGLPSSGWGPGRTLL